MFYPNAAPTNYRFRCDLDTGTYNRAGTEGEIVGTLIEVRTGEPYAATTCGIKLSVQNEALVTAADWYSSCTLVTPWGSYSSTPVINFDPTIYSILEIDDAQLTVAEGCSDWTFTFSEMRLYYQGSLVHTIAGNTDNGAAFDRRYCTMRGAPFAAINPTALYVMPTCGYGSAAYLSYVECGSIVGWQLWEGGGWVSRAIYLDLTQTVPSPVIVGSCPTCDCYRVLPTIEVDEDELSWGIYLYGKDFQQMTKTPPVTVECYCQCDGTPDFNCGVPWRYTCETQTHTFYDYTTEIWAAPYDAAIPTHIRETGAKCWCCLEDEPETYVVDGPNTENEQYTYAYTIQQVNNFEATLRCCTTSSVGACPLPGEGDPPVPPDPNCGYDDDNCFCAYRAYRQVTWGTAPCECTQPDIFAYPSGEIYMACMNGTNVQVKHRPTPTGPWDIVSLATSAGVNSWPCIVVDSRDMAILEYAKLGTGTMRRVSFDDGRTWTDEEVAITNGNFPRVACCSNGDVIRAAVVGANIKAQFQAGGDVSPGSLFTFKDETGTDIVVETTSGFGLDYSYGYSEMLQGVFLIDGEGTASNWMSTDDGRTWTRIS